MHMTNHEATCKKTTTLCDQLFEALQRKIPGLQIKYNDNLCSIWSTGAVIAWASPIMLWGGIRVWFVGDSQNTKKFPAPTIPLKIKPIAGMWGDYCCSFKISSESHLAEAAELLFTVSYPLTMTWFPQDARASKTRRPLATDDQKKVSNPIPGVYAPLAEHQFNDRQIQHPVF